jgi:NADPH:quinone reductase-like Zn-dependent oxidoreductase
VKAIMQDRYGSADVLELREVKRPVPAADEVLIRVRAAGVNMADWHSMTGEPTFARLFLGRGGPKEKTRGSDVAGVVEEVGSAVTRFSPGDEVFGSARGSFAEFAVARERRLAPKPANLSFVQAAAVSMAGYTALQALRAAGVVEGAAGGVVGEVTGGGAAGGIRVLVIGAAGGVGSFTVQLAKHFGAHVTGVCSTGKVGLVRLLGADAVIDYTSEPVSGEFDVVIDTAGGRSLRESRKLLAPKGTLVVVGGEGGGRVFGLAGRSLAAPFLSMFGSQKLVGLFATESADDLVTLAGLLASGAITPAIDRTFPLAEAADAIRHLEAGRAAGKVVVTVA